MFIPKVNVTESDCDWASIEEFCDDNPEDNLVYFEPDNSKGYISYVIQEPGIVVINKLFVRKDSRRQGIGKYLINHIVATVDHEEICVVSAISVKGFYRRCGFKDYESGWMVRKKLG
jgi:GNAT superfamily N-acetyltransferase